MIGRGIPAKAVLLLILQSSCSIADVVLVPSELGPADAAPDTGRSNGTETDGSPSDAGDSDDDGCEGAPDGTECGNLFDCTGIVDEVRVDSERLECTVASGSMRGSCSAGACREATEATCRLSPSTREFKCDARCARPGASTMCRLGERVTFSSLSDLCVTNATSASCQGNLCESEDNHEWFGAASCDDRGRCVSEETSLCGRFACREPTGCLTTCADEDDCADDSNCSVNVCVPE